MVTSHVIFDIYLGKDLSTFTREEYVLFNVNFMIENTCTKKLCLADVKLNTFILLKDDFAI